jgi:hypothetical protein
MRCTECRTRAKGRARRWRAFLAGDGVAIYCPKCAGREFGPRFARRSLESLVFRELEQGDSEQHDLSTG